MIGNYRVITLCGSTRFKEDFERVNKELTLAGHIVISVGCFGHSGDTITDEQKNFIKEKRSIFRSSFLLCVHIFPFKFQFIGEIEFC